MSFQRDVEKRRELPLTGSILIEVADKALITLLFEDGQNELAQLRLEEMVTLHRPNGEAIRITGTRPGASFNLDDAKKLEVLVGKTVKTAIANRGRLDITFYDDNKLSIVPEDLGQWHFQKPAPGTKKPYPRKTAFILTGSSQGFI
jgi:hypothetical protein